MFVYSHSLAQFRNLEACRLTLGNGHNILYGNNAQGKTNFLESVYLCATGRSHRTSTDRDMICFGQEESHLQMFVRENMQETGSDRIDIHLKRNQRKGAAINGVPIQKLGQLFGILLTVIFSPEDLRLIKSGPADRRRFMDMELCQLSPLYYYELQQYHRVLKQRNHLLKSLKGSKTPYTAHTYPVHSNGEPPGNSNSVCYETLSLWDEQMISHGIKIMKYRRDFVERISAIAGSIHGRISGEKEVLDILYKPNVREEDFGDKLRKTIRQDILLGSTSTGVHKDDLLFHINKTDVRIYGSQGQQRTASLSSKLAEIAFIREQKNKSPVLLLDDVLSELDESRQRFLLHGIDGLQSIITCTGVEDVLKKIAGDAKIYQVKQGVIVER